MSVPCSLRKCSSSSFLPRTPSEFRQASLTAFRTCVPLDRAVKLSCEEDNDSEDCLWAGLSGWEFGAHSEKTACHLYRGLGGKVLKEIGDPLAR